MEKINFVVFEDFLKVLQYGIVHHPALIFSDRFGTIPEAAESDGFLEHFYTDPGALRLRSRKSVICQRKFGQLTHH